MHTSMYGYVRCCRQHRHQAKMIPGGTRNICAATNAMTTKSFLSFPLASLLTPCTTHPHTHAHPHQACLMAELFMKLCALIPHVTVAQRSSPRQKEEYHSEARTTHRKCAYFVQVRCTYLLPGYLAK